MILREIHQEKKKRTEMYNGKGIAKEFLDEKCREKNTKGNKERGDPPPPPRYSETEKKVHTHA